MRNVFDQYDSVENRVTHALVTSLAEDPRLLRSFLKDLVNVRPPEGRQLRVVEQAIPGERAPSEEAAEARGLPDGWIHNGDKWAVLIESKLGAPVSSTQLRRHLAVAMRQGFEHVHVVLIAAAAKAGALPSGARVLRWEQVYAWLRGHAAISDWARRAAEFLVITEARMIEKGQSLPGKLTAFSGVPFGADHPYDYGEAKLVLEQALAVLRSRSDLQTTLGLDPKAPGRPAITGRDGTSVWDFLQLHSAGGGKQFTNHPHLTLSIEHSQVYAHVTIPNGIAPPLRRRVRDLPERRFYELMGQIERNMRRIIARAPGAVPWFVGVQRHYHTQRSQPIVDARLEFDLRAAVPALAHPARSSVKPQPVLLEAAFRALKNRRPNYQMAVGVAFPYRECRAVRTRGALDLFARAWLACRPILDEVAGPARNAGHR